MTWSTKKSDKLEVRLEPDVKRDFLLRCQAAGQSASETLRDLIRSDARSLRREKPPALVRLVLSVAGAGSLLFAVAGLGATGLAILQGGARLGLIVFMISQSVLFTVSAMALLRSAWRWLMTALAMTALLQAVYASEVTPPAPFAGMLIGIVVGGMGPTILVALASIFAWAAMKHSQRLIFVRAQSD